MFFLLNNAPAISNQLQASDTWYGCFRKQRPRHSPTPTASLYLCTYIFQAVRYPALCQLLCTTTHFRLWGMTHSHVNKPDMLDEPKMRQMGDIHVQEMANLP